MNTNAHSTRYKKLRRWALPAAVNAAFLAIGIAAIYFSGLHTNLLLLAVFMAMANLLYILRLPQTRIFHTILFLLIPAAVFILAECFYRVPWNGDMNAGIIALNVIFYYIAAFLLFSLIGNAKIALCILILFYCAFGAANYYVTLFRSSPILPWDLASIKVAMSVANNFTFTIEYSFATIIGLFLLLLIAASRCELKIKTFPYRFLFTGTAMLCMMLFTNFLHRPDLNNIISINNTSFFPKWMCEANGLTVNFIYNCQFISPEIPADYRSAEAEVILNTNEEVSSPSELNDEPVNIIVMMNETFSDPAVLGELQTNEDYIPFVHSLQQQDLPNAMTGNLYVSIVGGNTANSEFEFLTGNTMAFLPGGSIPYQQYIKSPLPNMADTLKKQGYTTYALHPYHADGWNRKAVYSYLGFDHALFLEDFDDQKDSMLRNYISDEGCVDKIIDLYESHDGDPLFFFNVTMQNHSGYEEDYDNFQPSITVDGYEGGPLTNYLSLLKYSDQALEKLVTYFSDVPEKTIIVFFGDHQPNNSIADPIYLLNGKDPEALSPVEQGNRYIVPYVIWANYDLEKPQATNFSSNFLGNLTLDLAGVQKNSYENFLSGLMQEYPIITPSFYQSKNLDCYTWEEPQDDLISEYQRLQYYQLFDRK